MSGDGGVEEDSGSGENTRPVSLWIAHGSRSVTLHSHEHDGRKSRHIQIKFQMKHEIPVEYVQLITKTFQYQ